MRDVTEMTQLEDFVYQIWQDPEGDVQIRVH